MHAFSHLVVISLPLAALAAPYQVSLADFTTFGDGKVAPAWHRENEQLVVPLSPLARTGLVDPLVEEGLISLAGNYFFNKIYEHANDSDMSAAASWRCIRECGTTIATAVPCLFAALAGGRPEDALKCVGKKTLCGCHDCLPKPIDDWLQQIVCTSGVAEVADKFSPYVDFSSLAGSSVSVSAFRGDLYKWQVEQLAAINKAGAGSGSIQRGDGDDDGDVHAQCVVGSSCGGCGCCVGVCVLGDNCVGVCA